MQSPAFSATPRTLTSPANHNLASPALRHPGLSLGSQPAVTPRTATGLTPGLGQGQWSSPGVRGMQPGAMERCDRRRVWEIFHVRRSPESPRVIAPPWEQGDLSLRPRTSRGLVEVPPCRTPEVSVAGSRECHAVGLRASVCLPRWAADSAPATLAGWVADMSADSVVLLRADSVADMSADSVAAWAMSAEWGAMRAEDIVESQSLSETTPRRNCGNG